MTQKLIRYIVTMTAMAVALVVWTTPAMPQAVPHGMTKVEKGILVLTAGSFAMDVTSSWGRRELNPVLGKGDFGRKQLAIKAGINLVPVIVALKTRKPKALLAVIGVNVFSASRNWAAQARYRKTGRGN